MLPCMHQLPVLSRFCLIAPVIRTSNCRNPCNRAFRCVLCAHGGHCAPGLECGVLWRSGWRLCVAAGVCPGQQPSQHRERWRTRRPSKICSRAAALVTYCSLQLSCLAAFWASRRDVPQGVAQHSPAMQLLIVTLVRVVMCPGGQAWRHHVEAWQHHVVQAGFPLGLQATAQVSQPGHCNVPVQTPARHMQHFCDGFGCNVADGWVVAGSGYDRSSVADFAGLVFARCAQHLLEVD